MTPHGSALLGPCLAFGIVSLGWLVACGGGEPPTTPAAPITVALPVPTSLSSASVAPDTTPSRPREVVTEKGRDEASIQRATTEARNTMGAIVRGAIMGYEREPPPSAMANTGGASTAPDLCASARPVPGIPPRSGPYTASEEAGEDFQTGDGKAGWVCLKFSAWKPIEAQYEYRAHTLGHRGLPPRSKCTGVALERGEFEVSATLRLSDRRVRVLCQGGRADATNGTASAAPTPTVVDRDD